MNEQVDTAVLNNIVWCGIVCDTHGIARTSSRHVWGVLSKAPTYYPDIITSSRHVTIDEVNDFIGDSEISSVKDSLQISICHLLVLKYYLKRNGFIIHRWLIWSSFNQRGV